MLALLRQVTHQSLRTPRVSPHIGRRGQWPWCAGAGFCVGVGVGAALVGFTVLVGGAGCAAGVLGDGWMRVAGVWVSVGVFGDGWMRVAGVWVSVGVFGVRGPQQCPEERYPNEQCLAAAVLARCRYR